LNTLLQQTGLAFKINEISASNNIINLKNYEYNIIYREKFNDSW